MLGQKHHHLIENVLEPTLSLAGAKVAYHVVGWLYTTAKPHEINILAQGLFHLARRVKVREIGIYQNLDKV